MAKSSKISSAMDKSEAMAKLREAKMAVEEAQKKVRSVGKKAVGQLFQDFFKEHPEIEAIRWRQYTPHFNDGDACEFGFHGTDVKIKDMPEAYVSKICDEGDGFIDIDSDYNLRQLTVGASAWDERTRKEKVVTPATPEEKKYGQWLKEQLEIVQDFWSEVSDMDVFEAALGDHIQVTATADGLEAEEYSHD